jgi:hypothetical protein
MLSNWSPNAVSEKYHNYIDVSEDGNVNKDRHTTSFGWQYDRVNRWEDNDINIIINFTMFWSYCVVIALNCSWIRSRQRRTELFLARMTIQRCKIVHNFYSLSILKFQMFWMFSLRIQIIRLNERNVFVLMYYSDDLSFYLVVDNRLNYFVIMVNVEIWFASVLWLFGVRLQMPWNRSLFAIFHDLCKISWLSSSISCFS